MHIAIHVGVVWDCQSGSVVECSGVVKSGGVVVKCDGVVGEYGGIVMKCGGSCGGA